MYYRGKEELIANTVYVYIYMYIYIYTAYILYIYTAYEIIGTFHKTSRDQHASHYKKLNCV